MGRRDQVIQVDPMLYALGSLGRYQLLQGFVQLLCTVGAAHQLLCNIFVGRDVDSHQCASYKNSTSSPDHGVDWNTSNVTYGQCEITVSKDNQSKQNVEYTCLFGQDYSYSQDLSFRTEFDLVCDRKLLGGLVQTFVILGQGVGAVLSSIFADRFGRKKVLVACEVGLLAFGVGAGFSPSYAVLAAHKFIIGCCQQAAGKAEERAEIQHCQLRCSNWFHIHKYLDESLRWLVANGRMKAAAKVLKRAARTNRKDVTQILKMLDPPAHQEGIDGVPNGDISNTTPNVAEKTSSPRPQEKQQKVKETSTSDGNSKNNVHKAPSNVYTILLRTPEGTQGTSTGKQEDFVDEKPTKKLTILDIFRHRRLLLNAVIMWLAWFTSAFAFFAFYMMSSSLYGDRFVNYLLTSLMEMPPGLVLFLSVDRFGRKGIIRPLFALAGIGLISSGLLRYYAVNSTVKTLSVVAAMLGMAGASGVFAGVFFYTPEMFPTNVRSQALGISSFAGRLGGMVAPFMTDLADIAVWAPGAIIGTLCFVVVIIMHFLPETKGRELPVTIEDIEGWYQDKGKKETRTIVEKYIPKSENSI